MGFEVLLEQAVLVELLQAAQVAPVLPVVLEVPVVRVWQEV